MAKCRDEDVVSGRVHRLCQPCEDRGRRLPADLFCSSCDEFQCYDCSRIHKICDFLKNHELFSESTCMYKSQSQQCNIRDGEELDMNGLDICKIHNERFKFYCERDKVLACRHCAVTDHTKCKKIVEIHAVATEDQLKTLRIKIQATILTANHAVENLKEADSCLRHDIQGVTDKLTKKRIEFIRMFDEFADEVTKDADSYRDKTTSDWTLRTRECEDKIKTLKRSLKTITDIEIKGTAAQRYLTEKCLAQTVQKDVKNAESVCDEQKKLKVYCNFDKHIDSFKSRLVSTLKPGEYGMKYSVPITTRLKLIVSISLHKTGSDKEQPYYTGLDFLPDGRLVVVDNFNGKCKVYDENLNLQTSFKLPYHAPKDVVAVSDNEVAITTGKDLNIDFLQLSKSNNKTVAKSCKVSAKYDSISIKDDKTFVASTIDHIKPVRLVSMSGEEKDFDIKFPLKKYPIGTSFCTYIRGQDKVVLTDRGDNSVFIYDVRTSEKIIVKDEVIRAPLGVAIGSYDHIFVCCVDTQSLVEISPAGRVLSSCRLDMPFPCFVAISKDKRMLAVSNKASLDKKLSLYHMII